MRPSPERTELARARVQAQMRQKELAATLGVHRTHLAKVEAGQRQSVTLTQRAMAIIRTVKR